MSIPSAALTLTVNGVPLKVLPFPNAVAIFNLDLEPDGSKTNYSANMDPSFGAGRARFEFGASSNIIPGPGTASGNIYILPIPGYKVISAPSRAYVGQPEWGIVELEPSVPPFKDRLTILNAKIPFQGFYVDSNHYGIAYQARYGGKGQIPFFGAALADFMAVGDLDQVLDQMNDFDGVMAFVDTGGPGYNEPGQPYGNDQLIQNFNCWDNFDVYLAMVDNIISRGKIPVYCLDGEGSPDWIKANLQTFVDRMRVGYDRLKYGVIEVVFDGVWPAAWSVDDMKTMIPWMRSIIGNEAYLSFWFGNGPEGSPYLYVENESDYSQEWMDGLDGVQFTTGPDQVECPAMVNYMQYMYGPNLKPFGVCTPDWQGPYILKDCSRGPRVAGIREYMTYQTVRDPNQEYKPIVAAIRQKMIELGFTTFG